MYEKEKKTGYNQYVWYFAASKVCIKNLLHSLNILLGAQVIKYEFQIGKKTWRKTFLCNTGRDERWVILKIQLSCLSMEMQAYSQPQKVAPLPRWRRNTTYEAYFLLSSGSILCLEAANIVWGIQPKQKTLKTKN